MRKRNESRMVVPLFTVRSARRRHDGGQIAASQRRRPDAVSMEIETHCNGVGSRAFVYYVGRILLFHFAGAGTCRTISYASVGRS